MEPPIRFFHAAMPDHIWKGLRKANQGTPDVDADCCELLVNE